MKERLSSEKKSPTAELPILSDQFLVDECNCSGCGIRIVAVTITGQEATNGRIGFAVVAAVNAPCLLEAVVAV